jgi:hypothetical protein
MRSTIASHVTDVDELVLRNLIRDVDIQTIPEKNPNGLLGAEKDGHDDLMAEQRLLTLVEDTVVFTAWDLKDMPTDITKFIVRLYITRA